MDKLQIKSSSRDIKVKPEKLRKAGQLPAVLYGEHLKNQNLAISQSDFEKIYKKAGESTIIEVTTDDGVTHSVLIHDIQFHYLTSRPIHVDFYEVSMSKKLKTKIVLEYVGESKAVKELGGILVKNLSEVEVECLPADLPHSIIVDVAVLSTLNSTMHVKDIKTPTKVKILTSPDEMVAKVQPPRDVEAELSTPVVEDISKVEGAAEDKPAADKVETDKKPEKAEKA